MKPIIAILWTVVPNPWQQPETGQEHQLNSNTIRITSTLGNLQNVTSSENLATEITRSCMCIGYKKNMKGCVWTGYQTNIKGHVRIGYSKIWRTMCVRGVGGSRWRSWLRHCATSRKVAGSITDIDIILSAAPWPWGWPSLQQKWVPGIFPEG